MCTDYIPWHSWQNDWNAAQKNTFPNLLLTRPSYDVALHLKSFGIPLFASKNLPFMIFFIHSIGNAWITRLIALSTSANRSFSLVNLNFASSSFGIFKAGRPIDTRNKIYQGYVRDLVPYAGISGRDK